MTEPGMVFLPKPGWWVRKDRVGVGPSTYGWTTQAHGGATARFGHSSSGYSWSSGRKLGTSHYDRFTRANSTTTPGPDWTNVHYHVGIEGNQTSLVNNGVNAALWKTPMTGDNFIVSATLTDATTDSPGYLLFGCNDTGSSIVFAAFKPALNQSVLATATTWALTDAVTVGSAVGGLTFAPGNTVSVERTSNVYLVKINGNTCWTWTDSGGAHPIDSSHRRVGLGGYSYYGIYTATFDDFFAKEL